MIFLRLIVAVATMAAYTLAATVNIASQATFTPDSGMTGAGSNLNDGDTEEGETWNAPGTVNWNLDTLYIMIAFTQAHTFKGAQIWGDSDDVYRLEAWDGDSWEQMFVVPHNTSITPSEIFGRHAGLIGNDPFHASFASFTTNLLRISRQSEEPNDGEYSLSEVELYVDGAVGGVPEPSTFVLMSAGLAALVLRRRS